MPVESIGSLSLSTQTAGSVGSFLCPGQTEQVVFSEGAGLIRHRREGPAHKSQLVLPVAWPCLGTPEKGDEGKRGCVLQPWGQCTRPELRGLSGLPSRQREREREREREKERERGRLLSHRLHFEVFLVSQVGPQVKVVRYYI